MYVFKASQEYRPRELGEEDTRIGLNAFMMGKVTKNREIQHDGE